MLDILTINIANNYNHSKSNGETLGDDGYICSWACCDGNFMVLTYCQTHQEMNVNCVQLFTSQSCLLK
jgi:hypothetical protein